MWNFITIPQLKAVTAKGIISSGETDLSKS